MIALTKEQWQALQHPHTMPPRLVNPETQETFVLVPLVEYERLQEKYDAGPWTEEERDTLRAEALESLGWEGMDAYQERRRACQRC